MAGRLIHCVLHTAISSVTLSKRLQLIALVFEHCELRGLAGWQKLSIFKTMEHHGIKEDA